MSQPWLCYVTSRLPWPPVSGAERRVHQHLELLQLRFRICLISTDRALTPSHLPPGEPPSYVDDIRIVRSGFNPGNSMRGARGGWPLQVARHYEPRVHRAVRIAERDLEPACTIYSLVRAAPYMDGAQRPTVLDYCDALALQFRLRARKVRPPRAALFDLESRLLARYEDRCGEVANSTIITSVVDADAISGERRPLVVRNPFDMDEPEVSGVDVRLPVGPLLVCSGDMSTEYSAKAVHWFADKVLPRVVEVRPDATFVVVGRDPTPSLVRLARRSPRILLTGAVPKVGPYLRAATVAVVPLMFGTGVKNKVLEAFAAGTPVVATSVADVGMGAAAADAMRVADEPNRFAAEVLNLIASPELRQQQAEAAKTFAMTHYSSSAVEAGLLTAIRAAQSDFERGGSSFRSPGPTG